MNDYERLYSLLSACTAAVKSAADCSLAQGATRGLDFDGLLLLAALSSGEEMRIQQLASALNRDITTTSRHVASLTARGWLIKRVDPHDRRVRYVRLTELAATALQEAQGRLQLLYGHILAKLSPIEQQELARMLALILEQQRTD